MFKTSYIITLLGGIGIFNSCTANMVNPQNMIQYVNVQKHDTVYGNYLAGRLALIRQDYDNAAIYHVKALDKGFENEEMLNKTYMILAATGRIDEAVKYANKARQMGNDDIFIDVINAISSFKKGNYRFARESINKVNERPYTTFVNPLFNAWTYVGEGNYFQAMNALKKLETSSDTHTVSNIHSGIISEYFDKTEEAEKFYDKVISNDANDVSFRVLQIISNFFVRIDKKTKATQLVSRYYGSSNIKEMLGSLSDKIKEGTKSIAGEAFKSCYTLLNIKIPVSIEGIGAAAFSDCEELTSVIIPDTVVTIGKDAFRNVRHISYHGSAQSENNWGALSWS